MLKKGDFGFEQLMKLLIAVIFLIVIIALIFLFKEKGSSLINDLANFLRFGK